MLRLHRWLGIMCALSLALLISACNLTRATPTPAASPTDPMLFVPSVTPMFGGSGSIIGAPTPVPVEGADPNCPPPPGWVPYTVEPGDSLLLLADQTDSTVNELSQANCLLNADAIFVGQVLFLPREPVVSP